VDKSSKFILRTFVGGVVGVILLNLIGGPNAMSALGLAIICTAGLSLIVIIPIAYIIGLICTVWWLPIEDAEGVNSGTLTSIAPEIGTITYIQRASLEKYIRNQLKNGKDIEAIRLDCRSIGGWSDENIDDVIDVLKSNNQV